MKILIIFMIVLLFSVCFNVYFFYEEHKENKRLQELYERQDNSPEFMKNGEWFNIILNGYKGEK